MKNYFKLKKYFIYIILFVLLITYFIFSNIHVFPIDETLFNLFYGVIMLIYLIVFFISIFINPIKNSKGIKKYLIIAFVLSVTLLFIVNIINIVKHLIL